MRVFFGIILMVSSGSCARILAILPVPSKSHYSAMEPLLKELAARGHQLTVYSSFPQKKPLPNFTDIDCSEGRTIYRSNFDFDTIERMVGNEIQSMQFMVFYTPNDCEHVFKKSPLKFFDYRREHYDLVITEMFAGDCFVHFASKLNVPLISMVTSTPEPWVPDNFGLPDDTSYIPSWSLRPMPETTLKDRIKNTIIVIYGKAMFKIVSNPSVQRIAEEYFQEKLPWVEDVARNSSFLLINSHFTVSQSRPLTPNVAYIGGIHIKEQQPLPQDLKGILDNSPQGVILFSFGSLVSMSSIPKKKLNIFFKVFSKITQTVILKNEKHLPDLPQNVITRSWLPLRDMLEHKNVLAFVSHGGIASLMEAVYCAKPVVGIPLFADQFININNLVWKGAAVTVDFDSMMEQDLEHAINEVVNNSRILENMKRLSQQFRDRPMSALQTAVYWTEYVLRHQGAPHLRPASTSLHLYQLWLLDVIAVLLACLVVVLYTAYLIVKYIVSTALRKVTSNSNEDNLKKEKLVT